MALSKVSDRTQGSHFCFIFGYVSDIDTCASRPLARQSRPPSPRIRGQEISTRAPWAEEGGQPSIRGALRHRADPQVPTTVQGHGRGDGVQGDPRRTRARWDASAQPGKLCAYVDAGTGGQADDGEHEQELD
jgi:hypothetical protein